MKARDRWATAALAVGLVPEVAADDPGVLMLFDPATVLVRGGSTKVGLLVIRDDGVTYAVLDGRVFDTITSDRRPLNVQVAEALREWGRR